MKAINEMFNGMVYCVRTLGDKSIDDRRVTVTSIGDSSNSIGNLSRTSVGGKIGLSKKMTKLLDKLAKTRKTPLSPQSEMKSDIIEEEND